MFFFSNINIQVSLSGYLSLFRFSSKKPWDFPLQTAGRLDPLEAEVKAATAEAETLEVPKGGGDSVLDVPLHFFHPTHGMFVHFLGENYGKLLFS